MNKTNFELQVQNMKFWILSWNWGRRAVTLECDFPWHRHRGEVVATSLRNTSSVHKFFPLHSQEQNTSWKVTVSCLRKTWPQVEKYAWKDVVVWTFLDWSFWRFHVKHNLWIAQFCAGESAQKRMYTSSSTGWWHWIDISRQRRDRQNSPLYWSVDNTLGVTNQTHMVSINPPHPPGMQKRSLLQRNLQWKRSSLQTSTLRSVC